MGNAEPIKYIFLSGVFISIILMASLTIVYHYNTDVDMVQGEYFDELNETFYFYDDLTESKDSLVNNINSSDEDFNKDDPITSLFTTGWTSLKGIFSSFRFMIVSIGKIPSLLGVPVWFTTLIITGIMIIIVFSIWSLIFGDKF